MEFGRAMGLDEPVTPVFPNSDYWYGRHLNHLHETDLMA